MLLCVIDLDLVVESDLLVLEFDANYNMNVNLFATY